MGSDDDRNKTSRPPASRADGEVTRRFATTPAPRRSPVPSTPARPSGMMRLANLDFDLVNAARRIVEGSLGLVRGERVLLLFDAPRHDMVPAIVDVVAVAGGSCEPVSLNSMDRPFRQLPESIRAAMQSAQASIMLIGFEDGEQAMRMEFLQVAGLLGLRHAHMIGVTRKSMIAGFSVDPARMVDVTRAVRMRMRPDSILKLRTPGGSDLTVKLSPAYRWSEHLGNIRAGRWENLPAGELLTSPLEVNGAFVCDASLGPIPSAVGLMVGRPLRLEIENNQVRSVQAGDSRLVREVESFLRREHQSDRVGTIRLGTNVGILEPTGDPVCDQNLPGLHIALGSTLPELTGAPASTNALLSFTCAASDVDLDGAPLLRKGRYVIV